MSLWKIYGKILFIVNSKSTLSSQQNELVNSLLLSLPGVAQNSFANKIRLLCEKVGSKFLYFLRKNKIPALGVVDLFEHPCNWKLFYLPRDPVLARSWLLKFYSSVHPSHACFVTKRKNLLPTF